MGAAEWCYRARTTKNAYRVIQHKLGELQIKNIVFCADQDPTLRDNKYKRVYHLRKKKKKKKSTKTAINL